MSENTNKLDTAIQLAGSVLPPILVFSYLILKAFNDFGSSNFPENPLLIPFVFLLDAFIRFMYLPNERRTNKSKIAILIMTLSFSFIMFTGLFEMTRVLEIVRASLALPIAVSSFFVPSNFFDLTKMKAALKGNGKITNE